MFPQLEWMKGGMKMDTGKKPITRFLEEYYKGGFSDFLKEKLGKNETLMADDAGMLLSAAYLEGFLDGVKLIVWAMDN